MENMTDDLCNLLISKGELKQQIFNCTYDTLQLFKDAAKEFEFHYKNNFSNEHEKVSVFFTNKNQYEFQIRFAGDVLVFIMHTNIFEFSRNHEVMHSNYIKEDKTRSYCGMIQIFNFLADSFKYNRINDSGYMIGRILINKDLHYFIEGKRELAQVLNDFNASQLNGDVVREILYSAIKYALNFDLLIPDYDTFKEISVNDIIQLEDSIMIMKTAKRLGFRFEADKDEAR